MGDGDRIDAEGGAIVYGNVYTDGGDFVGRDQYIIIQLPDGREERIPFQLPTRPEPFTGRKEQLEIVKEMLQPGRMLTICGPGGMGKTALAAEALWQLEEAGELRERFPGGVVRHDFYNEPTAEDAFRTIVKSFLGEEIGPEVIADLPGAAARLLAEKQPLLFLDGTENADDLLAVQETRGGCGLLQASRKRKDARGGSRLDLEPLPAEESVKLLEELAGSLVEKVAAFAIAEIVGYLPLALRLAGYHLNEQGEPATDFLAALQESPLRELDQGERRLQSVPVLLEKSLAQLPALARQLTAVAGRLALAPFSAGVLAAALEYDERDLRQLLQPVIDYGILTRSNDFYEFGHTLIHSYVHTELEVDEETLVRIADYYATESNQAWEHGPIAYPSLTAARPHVMALLHGLQVTERWNALLKLAWAVRDYLSLQGYSADLLLLARSAFHAAQVVGDHRDELAWLNTMGTTLMGLGRIVEAIEIYDQGLRLSRKHAGRADQAVWLGNLGLAYEEIGETEKAIHYHRQALVISREIGDQEAEGRLLGFLGSAYTVRGQVQKAIEYFQQGLVISREFGDRQQEGVQLANLADAYSLLGRLEEAAELHQQALSICREIGYRRGEATGLANLGLVSQKLGRVEEAVGYFEQALTIYRKLNFRKGEAATLGYLGTAYRDLERFEEAVDYLQQALAIQRAIGDRRREAYNLGNLATASADLGLVKEAIGYLEQALDLSRETGDRQGEGIQLLNLGILFLQMGQTAAAGNHLWQALSILREIESPHAEQARAVLKVLHG